MNVSEKTPESKKYHVPSVDSACRMLAHVCDRGEPVLLRELTAASGSSRTTALRIASSLASNRFLVQGADGRYGPGEFLQMLGERSPRQDALRRRAQAVLAGLAETTEETAHLAISSERQCLLEAVAQSPRPVRVASQAGSRVDYHCAATGKAILAHDDGLTARLRDRLELTKRTAHTISGWKQLDHELEQVRRLGYAVDEQEYHDGVRCVAVPLIGHDGAVLGALGLTGATSTLTKRRIPGLAKQLRRAAEELLTQPKPL
jgi:DNA-binding IclR family transcriptional regulator